MSRDVEAVCHKTASEEAVGKDVAASMSYLLAGLVGCEYLFDALPLYEIYEGRYRFDFNTI